MVLLGEAWYKYRVVGVVPRGYHHISENWESAGSFKYVELSFNFFCKHHTGRRRILL